MTKTRTFVLCRVCGKQHTNPRSSSICPKHGKEESERNEAERLVRPKELEYVSVPKELLSRVLEVAKDNSFALECLMDMERPLLARERMEFSRDREIIHELRNVADWEKD